MIVLAELEGASDGYVRAAIAGLGEHDRTWYAAHPEAQSPEQARVRYVPDQPGPSIHLLGAGVLLRLGVGSCGSIAAAQYGYWKARGAPAWLLVQRPAPGLWHALVRTSSGVWDPRSLGRGRTDAA